MCFFHQLRGFQSQFGFNRILCLIILIKILQNQNKKDRCADLINPIKRIADTFGIFCLWPSKYEAEGGGGLHSRMVAFLPLTLRHMASFSVFPTIFFDIAEIYWRCWSEERAPGLENVNLTQKSTKPMSTKALFVDIFPRKSCPKKRKIGFLFRSHHRPCFCFWPFRRPLI